MTSTTETLNKEGDQVELVTCSPEDVTEEVLRMEEDDILSIDILKTFTNEQDLLYVRQHFWALIDHDNATLNIPRSFLYTEQTDIEKGRFMEVAIPFAPQEIFTGGSSLNQFCFNMGPRQSQSREWLTTWRLKDDEPVFLVKQLPFEPPPIP